jgi:hypothetical protein
MNRKSSCEYTTHILFIYFFSFAEKWSNINVWLFFNADTIKKLLW